jgi:hypothetical protein
MNSDNTDNNYGEFSDYDLDDINEDQILKKVSGVFSLLIAYIFSINIIL